MRFIVRLARLWAGFFGSVRHARSGCVEAVLRVAPITLCCGSNPRPLRNSFSTRKCLRRREAGGGEREMSLRMINESDRVPGSSLA